MIGGGVVRSVGLRDTSLVDSVDSKSSMVIINKSINKLTGEWMNVRIHRVQVSKPGKSSSIDCAQKIGRLSDAMLQVTVC
mmetsp:Transcript_15930/g.23950  ORF Transcript_15930/g.23950 Transcript_15930/m.23950 type:complete len:80 (-) Transcript_15930:46-285(-)